ncbi:MULTISPECIES: HlyD family efflux transporter periplasmic adaptor subunit [Arthrobacter]|jgi:HlyD family secretion protein|uniref:Multidrug efflux pump subunit AcrA (Membrane-fusion protein) n=1 Tax=Arthrobacter bambusae TaxID=1338426 RepID=A0AAW8DL91_9MICC|nr:MULTISPECIES: HlyD family efflux transporter periplasmic adaptor subunit [Arthrobacter]MDP9906901.1 multidrug efflux pump subunit AcrA (membrane-fusion protein) [Arthrobacter bambusae]MDQ0131057.1 multidrug efflux pump subunit AcrA (membrane-fusion protein) [Arthrobacter bambusae]MDQ0182579.1 multidrug efflux pump subunit AcrA (membrane-fusion protein) [Arthrobacter bambusae]
MLSKPQLINGGIGVAVVGIAAGAFFVLNGVPQTAADTTARTVAVSSADLAAVSTASGNVSPASTTVINAQNCTGPIATVSAVTGQQVTAGQVLVTIDPTNAQNALAVAQAQLDSAAAQANQQQASASNQVASASQSLTNAQQTANLDASQQASAVAAAQTAVNNDNATVATAQAAASAQPSSQPAQNALSAAQAQLAKDNQALTQAANQQASSALKDKEQIASAATALNSAQSGGGATSNTTSAQIAVDTATKNLASCSLAAPVSGTVTAVNAVVGGNAGSSSGSSGSSGSGSSGASGSSGSSSTSAASTSSSGLITISDTAHLQVIANFAESDIAAMKTGDSATFTFPALKTDPSAAPVTGTITAIAQNATTTNNVVSYPVTISIKNPPAALRLGQSANISVTTATAKNALTVPSLAITTTGTRQTVNVMKNGTATAVTITTGITDNGRTQVLTGLSAGDQIELPAISSTLDTTGTTGRTGTGGLGGTGGFGGTGGAGITGGTGGTRGNGG